MGRVGFAGLSAVYLFIFSWAHAASDFGLGLKKRRCEGALASELRKYLRLNGEKRHIEADLDGLVLKWQKMDPGSERDAVQLRIVRSMHRVGVAIALEWSVPPHTDLFDLIQASRVGVLGAMRRFKPKKGKQFVGFARDWMRARVGHAVFSDLAPYGFGGGIGSRTYYYSRAKIYKILDAKKLENTPENLLRVYRAIILEKRMQTKRLFEEEAIESLKKDDSWWTLEGVRQTEDAIVNSQRRYSLDDTVSGYSKDFEVKPKILDFIAADIPPVDVQFARARAQDILEENLVRFEAQLSPFEKQLFERIVRRYGYDSVKESGAPLLSDEAFAKEIGSTRRFVRTKQEKVLNDLREFLKANSAAGPE